MKKRILAFLLAVITVFGAYPAYALPVSAEDAATEPEQQAQEEIAYADMIPGRLYSACWHRGEGIPTSVYLYGDADGGNAYGEKVELAKLPEILTVTLLDKEDMYVKTLNEDWPSGIEEYRYIKYSDIVIVDSIETEDGYIKGKIELSGDGIVNNKAVVSSSKGVVALAEIDDEIKNGARYQWQAKIVGGKWANITGYILPYASITYPLLVNVAVSGVARVRCLVDCGETKYISEELVVTLNGNTVSPDKSGTDAREVAAPSNKGTGKRAVGDKQSASLTAPATGAFEIAISYVFRHANPAPSLGVIDGTPAANTFTVSLPKGGYYSGSVATPIEVGYLPYVKKEFASYVTPGTSSPDVITYDGVEYVAANSIEFEMVTTAIDICVYFIPQEVDYIVEIYEQKLYDDNYTLVHTETRRGIADTMVGTGIDGARTGFTSVAYDSTMPIAENGTSVVQIYYDRNYYLVNYDTVSSAANGATSSLIRYNTPLALPAPTLKGYEFSHWSLVSVSEDQQGNIPVLSHSYASTVQAGITVNVKDNLLYRAVWNLANSYYTLVYWLEDAESTDSANKNNYNVWYTYRINTVTGSSTLPGADNVKNYITTQTGFSQDEKNDVTNTYPYLIYQSSLTDTESKTTVGDGTTAVNIYYSRKEYNLKFYYAIEKVSQSSSTYHVIGGSTYYFGSYASGTSQTDEVAAMRQYASGGYTSQTGQVTALPTLNEKGLSRNYINASDIDGSNKYHYLSFTAKYGADISNLWPCDVFNSAERTYSNTHGSWSGKQAFVSAWNGEYRVRYTQDSSVNNGNQTIKGNYTVLDANLLWNSTTVTDTTVTYACFWENGANINWSVPELYRYNIYVPVLPNMDTSQLTTKVYNGVTYYLKDQYNTCDDSTTSAQTQPGLVGFTSNGRTWSTISSYDTSLYKEAYDMFFFYSRNIYHLTFNDMHGNTVTLSVPYDTFIGDHSEEEHAPEYPSDLEPGEAIFDGWYYDETYTIFFDHNATMPAKNIQLYAKWKTLSYNVKVYYDTEKTQLALDTTVPFNTLLHDIRHEDWQSEHPAYANYIFLGWYYRDGGEEIRFDFNTMMIKRDLELYAKWTSKVFVDYSIYYVTYINGEMVNIAEPINQSALAGVTKYFVAEVGNDLYDGYRAGYFPEMRAHSMTMKTDEPNVYYFVYTHMETLTYTVTHLFTNSYFASIVEKDGFTQFEETFVHTISGEDVDVVTASTHVSFREGITRAAIANAAEKALGQKLSEEQKDDLWNRVKLMSPDCYEQELIITTNSQENEAVFYWENRGDECTYQIIYYFEDLHGEYIPDLSSIVHGHAIKGTGVTAETPTYMGYNRNLYNPVTGERYPLTGTVVGLSEENGTLTPGLILRVYYERARHNYTIHYYRENSTIKLSEPVSGVAPHGTVIQIADVAKDIPGYVLVINAGAPSVNIGSDNTSIICYYKALEVYYRYQITGSSGGGTLSVQTVDKNVVGEKPQSTTLTLLNDGYFVNQWYYVVGNGEKQAVPAGWISADGKTVSPDESPVDWAGKTIYIYAEVLPRAKRFSLVGEVANNKNEAFIFNIKSTGDNASANVDVTFVIFGNDYLDIEMLPHGEYTITVLNWSWRYSTPTLTYNSQTYQSESGVFVVNLQPEGDVVFNYSGTRDDKWITDEIYGYLHYTPLS